jgi:ArsR family transcriptional regulator
MTITGGADLFVTSLLSHIDDGRYLDERIDDCQYVDVRPIQQIDETCCPSFAEAPLGDQAAEGLAAALRVVADATRLRLLSLIAASPDGEGCVCDLTAPLGLSQPTVSHHLKVLSEAGVLDREKRGRWVYYRINAEPLAALQAALTPALA